MSKQTLFFNYFAPYICTKDENNKKIKKHWNMKKFCEFMLNHKKEIHSSVSLGEEIADFEWTEQQYDTENNLYWFRISKNRTKNIPYIKHLAEKGEPIKLDNHAYVGNYTLYVFDPLKKLLFVQSNFYGLTTKQSEIVLAALRQRYREFNNEKSEEAIVSLEPIIDPNALNKVKNSKYIRRLIIKGSDVNSIAATGVNSQTLHLATKAVQKASGINFEFSVSLGNGRKDKSIDKEETDLLMQDLGYLKSHGQSFSMSLATKKDLEHSVEVINLLEPRLKSKLILTVDDRAIIGAEYLYRNYLEQNLLKNPEDQENSNFLRKARSYVTW